MRSGAKAGNGKDAGKNTGKLAMRSVERVTLRDVARRAGVSEISVSRVMRQTPNISDALRLKVTEAADALGYTPNRVAGALKTATSNLVAVVLPSMSNEVFPQVLDGIESVLSGHGLCPVLGITQYDDDRELEVVRELLSWSPVGVILTGLNQSDAIKRMLAQHTIPVVQIMDVEGDPLHAAVGIAHGKAAREAADLLIDKGYRRPAYIGAWSERPSRSRIRRQAFEARLSERGFPLVAAHISPAQSSVETGVAVTAMLLAEHRDVDVIFYANDDLAMGGMFHCMSSGISVPNDVGLLASTESISVKPHRLNLPPS
ncbi:MAG: LacI family DNA-binding transcriptional regulator [Pseudomonadota bacterium]